MSEITGVIHSIGETQNVSPSFSKREFVIKEQSNPQYEQYIPLEFTQDKTTILDNYKEGQQVKVYFNYRGRLWQNKEGVEKCFLTLQAWKIEAQDGGNSQPAKQGNNQAGKQPAWMQEVNQGNSFADDDSNDLPF